MDMYTAKQPAATVSHDRAAELAPGDLDPGTHPIVCQHWFGIEPLRPIGPIAAEVAADLRFHRQVGQLHERRTA